MIENVLDLVAERLRRARRVTMLTGAGVSAAQPNAAHDVLGASSKRWRGCVVITQNVDDRHVRVGTRGLVVAACECDVFLSVGTSSRAYPAAAFLTRARLRGAFAVEINTELTPVTGQVDLALTGPADQLLMRVERLLEPISGT